MVVLRHAVPERANRLDSEISGNTLLYPTSARDCPGPERGVLYCYGLGLGLGLVQWK